MHYLIYKITDKINNKIYIGQHQTENIDDKYMGSGILIKKAIKKYGKENFEKEILFECSSLEEMNQKEKEIVNEDFIKRNDTYNLVEGGKGGSSAGYLGYLSLKNHLDNDEMFKKEWLIKVKNNAYKVLPKLQEGARQYVENNGGAFLGKKHTIETKQKISLKNKNNHLGERNTQYGKIWINNPNIEQNKIINKELLDIYLNNGWMKGRILNWEAYKINNKKTYVKPSRQKQVIKTMNHKLEMKKLYSLLYKYYKDGGWKNVLKHYDYKYSRINLLQQFKKYVPEYKK